MKGIEQGSGTICFRRLTLDAEWRTDDGARMRAEKLVRRPLWASRREIMAAWTDGGSGDGEKRSVRDIFGGQDSRPCKWTGLGVREMEESGCSRNLGAGWGVGSPGTRVPSPPSSPANGGTKIGPGSSNPAGGVDC